MQPIILYLCLFLFTTCTSCRSEVPIEQLNIEFNNIIKEKQILEKEELSLSVEAFEKRYLFIIERLSKLYNHSSEGNLGTKILMEIGMLYYYKLADYEKAIESFKKIIQKYPESYETSQIKEYYLKNAQKDLAVIQKNLSILKNDPKSKIAPSCLMEIAKKIYAVRDERRFKTRQVYWEIYKKYPSSKEAKDALYILSIYYGKNIYEKVDAGTLLIEKYPISKEEKAGFITTILDNSVSSEELTQIYKTRENAFVRALCLFGLAKKNGESTESLHKKRCETVYNDEGIKLLNQIDREFSETEVGDDALANLAIHYYSKNDLPDYKKILSLFKKKYPDGTDVLHLDGENQYWFPSLMLGYAEFIYRVEKDIPKAMEVYRRVIEKYPGSNVVIDFNWEFGVAGPQAQREIAEIYVEQREFKKAVDEYKKMVLEFPEATTGTLNSCGITSYGVVSLREITKIYEEKLNDKNALKSLIKDIASQSTSGDILAYCYNHLGESATKDGDFKTAISYYKQSASFDLSALEQIVQICITKLNNPYLAIKELEEIKKNNLKNPDIKGGVTYLIAKIYYDEIIDFEKANKLFKEFIINYPNGCGNAMEGPYYAPEEAFEKIITCYKKNKNYDALRNELNDISEKWDNFYIKVKSLFIIAGSFEEQSNKDKAIETYKKLINQYPDSEEAEKSIQKLKGWGVTGSWEE